MDNISNEGMSNMLHLWDICWTIWSSSEALHIQILLKNLEWLFYWLNWFHGN